MTFDNGVVVLWLMTGVKSDGVTGVNTVFEKELAVLCAADSWPSGCDGDSSLCECVSKWP